MCASPLPKSIFDHRKKNNSGNYSRNQTSLSSSSKYDSDSRRKGLDDAVEQMATTVQKNIVKLGAQSMQGENSEKEIESVAESLGTVTLSVPIDEGTLGESRFLEMAENGHA